VPSALDRKPTVGHLLCGCAFCTSRSISSVLSALSAGYNKVCARRLPPLRPCSGREAKVRCVFARVPLTRQSILTPPGGATPVNQQGPLPLHKAEVALEDLTLLARTFTNEVLVAALGCARAPIASSAWSSAHRAMRAGNVLGVRDRLMHNLFRSLGSMSWAPSQGLALWLRGLRGY
jgi:hypothetical protein